MMVPHHPLTHSHRSRISQHFRQLFPLPKHLSNWIRVRGLLHPHPAYCATLLSSLTVGFGRSLFWLDAQPFAGYGYANLIYPNDHLPAHVHVIGATAEAVFELHCPGGPVTLPVSDFTGRNSTRTFICHRYCKDCSVRGAGWPAYSVTRAGAPRRRQREPPLATTAGAAGGRAKKHACKRPGLE